MKTEAERGKMITLIGKSVSPGMAKGTAYIYEDVLLRDSELYLIPDIASEKRLDLKKCTL